MLSVGQQSLLGYLPAIIIKNILDGKIQPSGKMPQYYLMHTVSLFADISGFTKLSEAFSKKGRIGPEFLAFSLNRYMEQLINIIGKNGGDIFKFAGDAILVIWPENKNLKESCRRALQCALDIQSKLNNVEITPNKRLSVKIGIGVGECRILVVGGQFRRCEYLSVGEALRQACESETKATSGGQTICSEDVKKHVDNYFEMEEITGGENHGHGPSNDVLKYFLILKATGDRAKTKADAFLMRSEFNSDKLREKFPILKTFVPAAIALYLDIEKESWSKEIRMLTIMFLNLKVDLSQTKNDEGMDRIQEIVKTVQRSIYRTKGALNKFLMDDKGSVMLICWGLPPLSASDDHTRSVLSALTLAEELKKFNCGAYMGITTGTCFTGVCGTIGNRREYSLLGEVVNLSARYMGEAIKYAYHEKKEYQIFVDEKTKDLIQNKIRCEYVCSDELKGFVGNWHFYSPVDESQFTSKPHDPFPFVRTHRNNPISLTLPPNDKSDKNAFFNKSNFLVGRVKEISDCCKILNSVYLKARKEIIMVRGVTGSGKSLFIRRILNDFVNCYPELKDRMMDCINGLSLIKEIAKNSNSNFNNNSNNTKNNVCFQEKSNPPFIFTNFIEPANFTTPLNGFAKIMKEIYLILKNYLPGIGECKINQPLLSLEENSDRDIKLNNQNDTIKTNTIKCDQIGKILIKKKCIEFIKYIEEVLDLDLSIHYKLPENYENIFKDFQIYKLKPRFDVFFESRKYDDQTEDAVIKFFKKLVKKYRKFLNTNTNTILSTTTTNNNNSNKHNLPIIFITEDSHFFDDISINFIRALRDMKTAKKSSLTSFNLIISYQDPLFPVIKNATDKISKACDLLGSNSDEKIFTFMMNNLMELSDLQDLIRNHLSDKMLEVYKTTIDRIDPVILTTIVAKSFKGIPLFVLDLVDNLINSKKFVQVLSGELIVTSELMDMEEFRDWSNFTIPMRAEKILGTVIDSLTPKEILILKYASVIGNIFDIGKLQQNNPFNNIACDELEIMILNLERQGVLEILYDINPKQIVCKFAIPFMREILYQRMLIEQKNDIHLLMAQSLQKTNFKYLPHAQEVRCLELHLKTTEKTLAKHMDDEETDDVSNSNIQQNLRKKDNHNELNLNNLKIFLVKEICDRLKIIDLKLDQDDEAFGSDNIVRSNNEKFMKNLNLLAIKSGYIEKKSDANYTWEYRYVVITNTKVFYYYQEKEYLENRLPLGGFSLKNLFQVEILNDHHFGGKTNLFSIQVSQWFKKDLIKPTRKFYFSSKTREELFQWVITLNFLRIKATYDEFSSQFGMINLPLRHELKKAKKKFKMKFKGGNLDFEKKNSNLSLCNHSRNMNFYNTIARKSVIKDKKVGQNSNSNLISNNIGNANSSSKHYSELIRRESMLPAQSESEFIDDNLDKFNKSKNLLEFVISRTFIIFVGFIQEVFFDMEELNANQDKTIPVPKFLKKMLEEEESPNSSEENQDTITNNNNNINNKRESEGEYKISNSLSQRHSVLSVDNMSNKNYNSNNNNNPGTKTDVTNTNNNNRGSVVFSLKNDEEKDNQSNDKNKAKVIQNSLKSEEEEKIPMRKIGTLNFDKQDVSTPNNPDEDEDFLDVTEDGIKDDNKEDKKLNSTDNLNDDAVYEVKGKGKDNDMDRDRDDNNYLSNKSKKSNSHKLNKNNNNNEKNQNQNPSSNNFEVHKTHNHNSHSNTNNIPTKIPTHTHLNSHPKVLSSDSDAIKPTQDKDVPTSNTDKYNNYNNNNVVFTLDNTGNNFGPALDTEKNNELRSEFVIHNSNNENFRYDNNNYHESHPNNNNNLKEGLLLNRVGSFENNNNNNNYVNVYTNSNYNNLNSNPNYNLENENENDGNVVINHNNNPNPNHPTAINNENVLNQVNNQLNNYSYPKKLSKIKIKNDYTNIINQPALYQNLNNNNNDEEETSYSPMINKLKTFNVSIEENEDEFINYTKNLKKNFDTFSKLVNNGNNSNSNNGNNGYNSNSGNGNAFVFDNESNFRDNNSNISNNEEIERERKNSVVPRYTDPKYDFLKNEKSSNILKNVHSSNLFKNLLKK